MSLSRASLEEAMGLFNQQAFFEFHEVVEDLWRPLPPGPEKLFLQGFLQAGVGLYHLQKGNYTGAKNLLSSGLQKLDETTGFQESTLVHSLPFDPFALRVAIQKTLETVLRVGHAEAPHLSGIPIPTLKQLNG